MFGNVCVKTEPPSIILIDRGEEKAKFVQHPELQKQLLDTGIRPIGEADARDSF